MALKTKARPLKRHIRLCIALLVNVESFTRPEIRCLRASTSLLLLAVSGAIALRRLALVHYHLHCRQHRRQTTVPTHHLLLYPGAGPSTLPTPAHALSPLRLRTTLAGAHRRAAKRFAVALRCLHPTLVDQLQLFARHVAPLSIALCRCRCCSSEYQVIGRQHASLAACD